MTEDKLKAIGKGIHRHIQQQDYNFGWNDCLEHIIKLLSKHSPAELGNEPITYEPVSMCGDLCHLRSDDEGWEWKDHFIALIKGEK